MPPFRPSAPDGGKSHANGPRFSGAHFAAPCASRAGTAGEGGRGMIYQAYEAFELLAMPLWQIAEEAAERDDSCAVGQTLTAQELCSALPPFKKTHQMQTGVGHYGVFSGRRWTNEVYPLVRDIIYLN